MVILVCGGRDFANVSSSTHLYENKKAMNEYRFVMDTLNNIINPLSIHYDPTDNWLPIDIKIINGKAKGVDQASSDWASVNYAQLQEFPADWKQYGKAAGIIRNKEMLKVEKPDLVIAFPGGVGTAHMKKIAREAGIEVLEIDYSPS